jgi:tripartite-type tricarboxylate transporter receptor subunit TctC
MFRTRALRLVAAASMVLGALGVASAQDYPTKPIHMIVPFTPGGGTDTFCRLVSDKLSQVLGQQIVVENRPGAGGTIGTAVVAQADPDGYTLAWVSGSHTINPALYKDLSFDPIADFEPITMPASGPGVLVVDPNLGVGSVKELVELLKSKPGQINYASAGTGTPPHLSAELFKLKTGTDMVHIPYKGNNPAFVDMLAGRVSVFFPTIPSSLQYINGGQLKALAVTTAKRSSALPDVPTMQEAGVEDYATSSWYGILAPAGTPQEIVDKVQQATAQVLADPEMKKKVTDLGLEVEASTPADFAAFLKEDLARWQEVVAKANITVE